MTLCISLQNRYISPEQVPIQYGGLSVDFCDCNPDFSMSDPTTEIPIKPTTKQTVEIAIYEVRLPGSIFICFDSFVLLLAIHTLSCYQSLN